MEGSSLKHRRLFAAAIPIVFSGVLATLPVQATTAPGVGNVVTQPDDAFAKSYWRNQVSNVFATSENIVSCYRPEVSLLSPQFNDGPSDGYTGETACASGAANTGEDTGGVAPVSSYSTQAGSAAGYPAATPMLVKDRSESDIRVDPNHPNHV